MDSQKKVRRVSHYSSDMDILLVGEGDFSFAAALARAFQYAPRLLATSLDSREMLHIKYGELIMERRLGELGAKGAVVLHEVDLKTVLQNPSLCHLSFDRIIYNFPHSGFLPAQNENSKFLIRKHRELMRAFFKSASRLLKVGGEVHVAQHMCEPYSKWKLEEEAAKSGLELKNYPPFKAKSFSGYVSRRGDGDNANGTFLRRNPVTFIFFLPKASPPLRIVPSSLARSLASQPPPIIQQPLSPRTIPLHSSSLHTKRSPSHRKPPPLFKAHSSISIPCSLCVTPQPPPSGTIYSHFSPLLPSMTSPIPPIVSSHPPPSKISPPPAIKPSLSLAISSRPSHLPCLDCPPLQKPQPSISISWFAPSPTPTINPVSLPDPKDSPPPTPCITSFPPPQQSRASNIITTPSRPSALSTFEATTRAPIFTSSKVSKTPSYVSYTSTSSMHQLISSCNLMGSSQDSYKLDHSRPTLNDFSYDEYYHLPSSDDNSISEVDHQNTSESCFCTLFLMWIISCCTSDRVGSLT